MVEPWGWVPGSIGETNKFMILVAAAFLVYIKIINWRIVIDWSCDWLSLNCDFNQSIFSLSTNTMP